MDVVKTVENGVNEFVKKISVRVPDKPSGHRRQKSELVWNFIGKINLPGDDQTVERQRKGEGIARSSKFDDFAIPPSSKI